MSAFSPKWGFNRPSMGRPAGRPLAVAIGGAVGDRGRGGVSGGGGVPSQPASAYEANGARAGYIADFENDYFEDVNGVSSMAAQAFGERTGLGTVVDSDGLIKWGPHQFLPRTNALDNSSWIIDSGSGGVTPILTDAFAEAPDGTTTASRLQFDSGGTGFSRIRSNGVAIPFSGHLTTWGFWAKSNDANDYLLAYQDAATQAGTFTVTPEWQFFAFDATPGSTTPLVSILAWANESTDVTADILVWAPRLHFASLGGMVGVEESFRKVASDSTYIETTGTARYLPRIGYEYDADLEQLGDELITDGGFDAGGTGWTLNTWTISGGVAVPPGASEILSFGSTGVEALNVYRLEFDLGESTGGVIDVRMNSTLLFDNLPNGAARRESIDFISDGNVDLVFAPTSAWDGTVDNVTLRRVTGTYVKRGVRVEPAATNLVEEGTDLAQNNLALVTVTANGSMLGLDSFDLVEDTTNGWHRFSTPNIAITSGSTYVAAVRAKPLGSGSKRYMQILVGGSGAFPLEVYSLFDLEQGVVTTTGASVDRDGMVPLGDGSYLCYVVATADATNNAQTFIGLQESSTAARADTYLGDGASGVKIAGWQFEVGEFPSSLIPTAGSTVTRTADPTLTGAAANLPNSTTAICGAFKGRLDHVDASDPQSYTLLSRRVGSSDGFQMFVDTDRGTGGITFVGEVTGGASVTPESSGNAIPEGISVPVNAATRVRTTDSTLIVQGSINGVNTDPLTIASTGTLDLSTDVLDIAEGGDASFQGWVERILLWAEDPGDQGIYETTSGNTFSASAALAPYSPNRTPSDTVVDFANNVFFINGAAATLDQFGFAERTGAATQTDRDGLTVWAPHNLHNGTVAAVGGGGAITTGQEDPFGGTSAALINANTSVRGASFSGAAPNSGKAVVGAFVKPDGSQWMRVLPFNNSNIEVWFDLINLTIGNQEGGSVGTITQSPFPGWLYVTVETDTATLTSPLCYFYPVSGNGQTNSGAVGEDIIVAGVHTYRADLGGMADVPTAFRQEATLAKYLPLTASASRYLPRFEHHVYDPDRDTYVQKGLQAEGAATNVQLYSLPEEGNWVRPAGAIRAITQESGGPTGTYAVLEEGTTSAQHYVYANWSGTLTGNVVHSALIRRATGTRRFQLRPGGLGTGIAYANFDVEGAGAVASTGGSEFVSAGIKRVADDWYLAWLACNHASTPTNTGVVLSNNTTELPTYTGAGSAVQYHVAHVQAEAGLVPSSIIPTAGSTVTRTTDPDPLIAAADAAHSRDAVSVSMSGLVTYADTGVSNELEFWRRQQDTNNFMSATLDTVASRTGDLVVAHRTDGGSQVSFNGSDTLYAPGVNVPFNFASRQTSGDSSSAAEGEAYASSSPASPPLLPDISAQDLSFARPSQGFNGVVSRITVAAKDIGSRGIRQAARVEPLSYTDKYAADLFRPDAVFSFLNDEIRVDGQDEGYTWADVLTADSRGAGNATQFLSTGVLGWRPHNQFPNSSDLDGSAWNSVTTNVSFTSGVSDPAGGSTATTITSTGASSRVVANWDKGAGEHSNFTWGLWIRRRTGTGAINFEASPVGVGDVIPVTSEWQLFTMTGASGNTSTTWFAGLRFTDSGDEIDVAFARMYRSDLGGMAPVPAAYRTLSTDTSYVPTTGTARYLLRTEDYRYNGTAWVRTFTHEPVARTNLLLNSTNLEGTGWSLTGATLTAESGVAPDGTNTAFLFTPDGAAAYPSINQTVTVTGSTAYATSIYAKAAGGSTLSVEARGAASSPDVTFDLSTGEATVTRGTAFMTDVGNGWYRCTVVQTSADTSEIFIFGAGDGTPAASETILLWGPQVEEGSTPSSYIPTSGSTVTRTADVARISGDVMPADSVSVSVIFKGRATFGDNADSSEVRLWDWRDLADSNNYFGGTISTTGAQTGQGRAFLRENAGAVPQPTTGDNSIPSGSNVSILMSATARDADGSAAVAANGVIPSVNGDVSAANGLPDLSASPMTLGASGFDDTDGNPIQIDEIIIHRLDIGDVGREDATLLEAA